MEIYSFITDEEKMRDFVELTKEEFLASYSYLTEEEYDATVIDYYINNIQDGYITENVIKVLQLEKSPAAEKVCDTVEQLYQNNNISIIKRGGYWYFENCDPPHYVSVFLTVELLEKFHLKYLYW